MRALILSLLWLLWQAQPVLAGALERAMLGKATVVDLTHVVGEPASVPAGQELRRQESEEGEHPRPSPHAPPPGDLGTHLDVPAAGLKGKPTVAHVSPRQLLVQAVVVDIAALVTEQGEYRATVKDLQAWERRNGRIPKQAMVLLHTGWSRRWSDPARYLNLDPQGIAKVPGFSAAALAFLVNDRDVRGVGLDAFTPEGSLGNGSADGRALLLAGRFQIENLTNLDRLPPKGVKLVIMPLRVEGGSAPARVIAILP
ncbi:MAG TPA: cyclase family protein [Candidatus Methylomirabilis sp.]|nr:cyclase family protein [Candidatus Methylomirabilis sp.]